jgi:lysozyme
MTIQSTESLFLPHPGPYLALVTNNLDPNFMGGLEVMLFEGTSPDLKNLRQDYTVSVKYLPSFWGYTSYQFEGNNSASFNDSQKSYGMWAVPPDIGTVVLCMFVGGNKNSGFWMGVVPDPSQNHMVPGLPATQFTAMTPEQERKYGTRFLPTAEYNKKTRDLSNPKKDEYSKPIHPFADRLLAQGLLVDDIRGVTTSGSRRERPSSVFGISTPGPVDTTVNAPKHPLGYRDQKLTTFTSRLGGHQIVMDDGDKDGLNELFRIRTRTGHQILLHNSSDLIYIANAAGTAWIELTAQGKIDVYAADSVSIHTEGDFNLRAGRDFNIEAIRDINMSANGNFAQQVGGKFSVQGARDANYDFDGTVNMKSRSTVLTVENFLEVFAGNTARFTAGSHFDINSANFNVETSASVGVKAGTDLKLQAVETGSFGAKDIKLQATNILGAKGNVELRLTSPLLGLNGAPAPNAPPAPKVGKVIRFAPDVNPLPTYQLPDRDIASGWSDGKFYRAEDLISIMKRVPTHEPWPQHENINPKQFNIKETDLEKDNRGTGKPGKYATVEYKASANVQGTPPTPTGNKEEDNVTAFLWMLRCCEGTSGPLGYQTRFGPKGDQLFSIDDPKLRSYQFKDHPRIGYTYPTKAGSITSTAAGAYQFLSKTWDSCQKALSLPDFSPRSQDLGCIFLLKQAGALTAIKAGDFSTAINKTKRIWASLPGDVYGQGGKNFAQATAFFKQAGGSVIG